MPRAPHPCATPGCPTLTLTTTSHCPDHTRAKQRTNSRNRRHRGEPNPYTTTQWRTLRDTYRTTHPNCAVCSAPTTQVDHIIPRRILQAAGIQQPDHERWLQPLCDHCHSTKTATTDRAALAKLDAGTDPTHLATTLGYPP